MNEQARPARGRKRKFTPDELEVKLINAASAKVFESGVTYGLDSVRLDQIIAFADVPRGSAYEHLSQSSLAPQAELRRRTVLSILRHLPSGNAEPTSQFAIDQMAELADAINSSDIARRRDARAEVVRRVAVFNQERLASQQWRVYRSLVETALTHPERDTEIIEAVRFGEEKLLDAYETLFDDFASALRMALNEGFSIRQFVMSIYSLNEGLTNRVGPSYSDQTTSINGKEWTAFGIGCEALLDSYFSFVE